MIRGDILTIQPTTADLLREHPVRLLFASIDSQPMNQCLIMVIMFYSI
jgi:hypothetical protein